MSVVESYTVISVVLHLIRGVLPEWCTDMGATLWDKGKKKWVPLLIDELVKYQPISQRGAGYKDSTPKWIGNRPPNTESVNMYP